MRGVLIVGLLISVLLVAWLTLRSSTPTPTAVLSGAPEDQLGEDPPDAVRKSPTAAKKYIEGQSCAADCESKYKLCIGVADGAASEGRCQKERTACNASCAASGEPTP